jgi:hypothetical protein
MSDEPLRSGEPRPVIPIEEEVLGAGGVPIPEPGVVAPAPFAQVYSGGSAVVVPPPVPVGGGNAPPPPPAYYPPPYAQRPVDYRYSAGGYGRPGVIGALGVMSIVVASLGFLASLFSGCTGLMVMGTAQQAGRMGAVTVSSGQATAAPGGVGVDGLESRDRRVVVRALKSKMTVRLTAERERQLDGLLAEHGGVIFHSDGLNQKGVVAHVEQAGRELAAEGKASADFFALKAGPLVDAPGRIVLHDTYALYRSDDGATRLRVDIADPDAASPQVTAYMPLTEGEAQAVANQVTALSNGKLNGAQAATLKGLMMSQANSNWISSTTNIPGLIAQVKSAVVRADGTVTVTFVAGEMTLGPGGELVGGIPGGLAAAATGPTTAPAMMPPFTGPVIAANRTSYGLVILEAALSAVAAIFLLVVGIFVLRQSPASRWLLLVYAVVKTGLGVLGIVSLSWMMASLDASGADPYGMSKTLLATLEGFTGAALVLACVGVLYPVAVLAVVLGSRTVRDYFKMTG